MRPWHCAVSKASARSATDVKRTFQPGWVGELARARWRRADFANVAASTDGAHDGKNRILQRRLCRHCAALSAVCSPCRCCPEPGCNTDRRA